MYSPLGGRDVSNALTSLVLCEAGMVRTSQLGCAEIRRACLSREVPHSRDVHTESKRAQTKARVFRIVLFKFT